MSIPKQPSEFLQVGFDMTKALATGETIVSSNANGTLSAKAFDDDDVDVSSTIIEGAPSISSNNVLVMVKAGLDAAYNIQFLIPTSTGQVLEEDLMVSVANQKQT